MAREASRSEGDGTRLLFYSYSILSFVPDIARGEAANLGVIVVDDATGATAGAFLPDGTPKISALAPGWDPAAIIARVDTIRGRLGAGRAGEDAWIRSSERLRVLAGAMRNQLQLTEPRLWRAASLADAAHELYDQFVRPVGTPPSAPLLAE